MGVISSGGQWCQPPSQLEHLVWGRTRGQARSKQRVGVGQVPVFSENLKDQGDEFGLLVVYCGCSGYREGPVTSSKEPPPCTGALTSKLLPRELGLRPCTDLLTELDKTGVHEFALTHSLGGVGCTIKDRKLPWDLGERSQGHSRSDRTEVPRAAGTSHKHTWHFLCSFTSQLYLKPSAVWALLS